MNDHPTHSQRVAGQRPYWRRAHTDWRMWVGVILMLVAMLIYLSSGNLSWRPERVPATPAPQIIPGQQ